MPKDLLREGFIRVYVNVVLSDAYAADPEGESRLHYLHPRAVGVAADVRGESACVRAVAAAPLLDVILPAAVCAVQYQGNARLRPQCVEGVQEPLVHILDGTGGSAALKLCRCEVFARFHYAYCVRICQNKGRRAVLFVSAAPGPLTARRSEIREPPGECPFYRGRPCRRL